MKTLDTLSWFRWDVETYVKAKRNALSGVAQIPYWIFAYWFVLGRDEAMVILLNPLSG